MVKIPGGDELGGVEFRSDNNSDGGELSRADGAAHA
jgi:hypothetical protein